MLVTLPITLFRSIHLLGWSACNSPFAAEQAVLLLVRGSLGNGEAFVPSRNRWALVDVT